MKKVDPKTFREFGELALSNMRKREQKERKLKK